MRPFENRTIMAVTGLISIVLVIGICAIGIAFGNGSFSKRYHIHGTFSAAGQGLQTGSDVKVRGVNIGLVSTIKHVEGKARINMQIKSDQKIPKDATAIIRAKTLFGEKFVDIEPGLNEKVGPFLENDGVIRQTTGGYELEKILTDVNPVLKAINPDELAVILSNLARGGEGLGATINRSIANGRISADTFAAHSEDTKLFLDDLALLSDELAKRAPDVVGLATDANVALPELNAHAGELSTLLTQLSRLSIDLAEVFEANRGFSNKAITEGGKTIQVIYDNRGQISPLVRGLSQFALATYEFISRIPDPAHPGQTLIAAKDIRGGGPVCKYNAQSSEPNGGCPPGTESEPAPPSNSPATASQPSPEQLVSLQALPLAGVAMPTQGLAAVTQLIGGGLLP